MEYEMEFNINVVYGGLLLGVAAGLMMLLRGRILGCSGMIFKIASFYKTTLDNDSAYFMIGVFMSGLIYYLFNTIPNPLGPIKVSYLVFFFGGLLVGVGTYIGSGCTSGHGLCGIALLRKRSIIAVSLFFPIAMVTSWFFH
jgi:uncharacterized protein